MINQADPKKTEQILKNRTLRWKISILMPLGIVLFARSKIDLKLLNVRCVIPGSLAYLFEGLDI